jgi:hypothetical protein
MMASLFTLTLLLLLSKWDPSSHYITIIIVPAARKFSFWNRVEVSYTLRRIQFRTSASHLKRARVDIQEVVPHPGQLHCR